MKSNKKRQRGTFALELAFRQKQLLSSDGQKNFASHHSRLKIWIVAFGVFKKISERDAVQKAYGGNTKTAIEVMWANRFAAIKNRIRAAGYFWWRGHRKKVKLFERKLLLLWKVGRKRQRWTGMKNGCIGAKIEQGRNSRFWLWFRDIKTIQMHSSSSKAAVTVCHHTCS